MLAPDDRMVLREQLRPEPGDELEMAVGTTFSLDLTAALVVPLAFAAFDVSGTGDPVAVLEAVRAATGKVDVFCQAGQMRVPPVASDLMAFLEPMVHEVQAPVAGFLFHPKVWVLRYRRSDGERRFRLICGTRNLTDDVSWDAAVRLDGTLAAGRSAAAAANRPIVDLVKALPTFAVRRMSPERSERIDELAEDLRRVEWERPEGVDDVAFHVLGLRRTRGPGPLDAGLRGRRHLVVSPFVDDSGVATATASTAARAGASAGLATLVSRPEALERLDRATLDGLDCRILSPVAGLEQPDEQPDEEGNEEGNGDRPVSAPAAPDGGRLSLLGGLHAKVYVVEAGHQARMFLGSANATSAGLDSRNVEFMVEVVARRAVLGIDQLLGPDAKFATILERYEPTGGHAETTEEAVGRELENLLRRLAAQDLVAEVTPGDAGWTETVRGGSELSVPPDTSLHVSLLTTEGTAVAQRGALHASFERLATADVTPFVVLRVGRHGHGTSASVQRATVVRAELRGDPPGRLDEVIARQVDTPEKFLRFLALLLGLGESPFVAAGEAGGSGLAASFGRIGQIGLFELLVRAVADRPAAIADLDRLVERLEATEQGRAVLPEGFGELWSTVREAHRQLAGTR
jgi:hypothetical protein